jgi:hypothetical protein
MDAYERVDDPAERLLLIALIDAHEIAGDIYQDGEVRVERVALAAWRANNKDTADA